MYVQVVPDKKTLKSRQVQIEKQIKLEERIRTSGGKVLENGGEVDVGEPPWLAAEMRMRNG